MRWFSKLAGQSHFLSARDCIEAFKLFDADDTGKLEYAEMQEAMNTMLAPAEVDISSWEGQAFTPSRFRSLVEWLQRTYPQFHVAKNLMQYVRDNRGSKDEDAEAITDREILKIFKFFDQDDSGTLGIWELMRLWSKLQLPYHLILDERSMDGSVTLEELGEMLRKINEEHDDLDIDEKINAFVAELGGDDKPELPEEVDPDNDPAAADDDEDDPPNKKALLIGINYVGTDCELGGCINDANNQFRVLTEQFGFDEANIRVMTDESPDELKPTAQNIRDSLDWLVDGAEEGDYLFFAYSGHGSQLPAQGGSEPDGRNEILCPLDLQEDWWANSIADDYLYEVFYKRVPDGVRCLCVFDCCHSGTMADLSCTRGAFEYPGLAESGVDGDDRPGRFLPPPPDQEEEIAAAAAEAQDAGVAQRDVTYPEDANRDLIWTISGCQDDQTSADAFIDGQRQGACTWALISCLEEGGETGPWHFRYERLLEKMRKKLRKGGYSQIPAMACTEEPLFQRYYMANKP
mmetsp:Transcript_61359/g.146165  ORF Transcript_61359/g.146165 Transcript_61359/m.146165 type:complete len:518 (-) Transcript_61359:32-1585(-)